MTQQESPRSLFGRRWTAKLSSAVASAALAFGLAAATPDDAKALTVSLNFVSSLTTDMFGVKTNTANYTPYGFTGMNTAQIQAAILSSLIDDYLGYPTIGADASSPLPVGKELDINFVIGSGAPSNGDSEYYYVAIGNRAEPYGFLGQACLSCVRDETSGTGPNGVSNGAIVGSILVDNIALSLASLASSDDERINLLEGTIAHEIGHALSLEHPRGALANPGDSTFSLMATGASPTTMPNGERVKNRAFAYSEFNQLITAVGLRDVQSTVPEPSSLALVGLALAAFAFRAQTERRQAIRV